MPIIILKAIEELPIPLSLPPCVNRRESFLARVIQGGGHGGYGDDIGFYHHSNRVEGITFPSALVSKFSSLLIDEHQAAPVEDNKKTSDFLLKAQVSFHFPMPCPPYSTDPLNVNALPPWPRRSNHSSIFVMLTGGHLSKMSMSQLYRLNDRTFWFYPFMSKCVKYCNVTCQKRHWSEHKNHVWKHRAELARTFPMTVKNLFVTIAVLIII